MKKTLIFVYFIGLIVILFSYTKNITIFADTPTPTPVSSEETQKRSQELQNKINELSRKLQETKNKKASLTNQIVYMDTQIHLTELKIQKNISQIAKLKEEIEKLSDKITILEGSLDRLSILFIDRVKETYKVHQIPVLFLFLTSSQGNDIVSRMYYFQRVQNHDKKLMYEVQSTKSDFEEQKNLLSERKKELNILQKNLENQKQSLAQQKKDKEYLLEVTKNDEKRYQELLASAQAELEAIQAIIAGNGTEIKVRHVEEGEKIASVINGASCNSNGTHLHFMVREGESTVKNPFSYLTSIAVENCSGSSCGSSDGDLFNPSGSWRWPLDPTIKFNQGYGATWAVHHIPWLPYSFHNGIDIGSASSLSVYAVQSGTLYQGSYTGTNGCALRYVRVDHDNSDLDTLYLHINY